MVNWGGVSCANYLRLVFANEPVDRLRGIRERFQTAFVDL
jgi:hypothetical protein